MRKLQILKEHKKEEVYGEEDVNKNKPLSSLDSEFQGVAD